MDNGAADDNTGMDLTRPGRRDRKTDGHFEPGDLILNRYKVLSELGQGGMGVVYKCFDETAGVEIALKALPPELSHNTLEMEDIKENFQLVSKLVHQNIAIAKTLEKDSSNGCCYLIMECADGENLRSWIRRRRQNNTLSPDVMLPVIRQVAEALDYAHSRKVIHRDIKPGNIMISADGFVKVLDFGLAAQIHTSMTRISMAYHGTSGTGPYMAPEQWRGRSQGASADQYALAVMTYEMLAGHLPFESTDAAVLREVVLNDTPEELENVSRAMKKAIARAMRKEPAERFASCSDFVAAMEGKYVRSAEAGNAGEKNNSRLLPLAIAAVILLFLGGGVFFCFYVCSLQAQKKNVPLSSSKQKLIPEMPASAKPEPVKPDPALVLPPEPAPEPVKPDPAPVLPPVPAPEPVKPNPAPVLPPVPAPEPVKPDPAPVKTVVEEQPENFDLLFGQVKRNVQLYKDTTVNKAQTFGEKLEKAEVAFFTAESCRDSKKYKDAQKYLEESLTLYRWIEQNLKRRDDIEKELRELESACREAEKRKEFSVYRKLYNTGFSQLQTARKNFENGEFDKVGDPVEKCREILKQYEAACDRFRAVRQLNEEFNQALDQKNTGAAETVIERMKKYPDTENLVQTCQVKLNALLKSIEEEKERIRIFTVKLADFSAGARPLDMIRVEPGAFKMTASDTKKTQCTVTLTQPFYISRYEITLGQWRAVMGTVPAGMRLYDAVVDDDDQPVCFVSYDEALLFCEKLTEQERRADRLPENYEYSLPTEAQWEFAARGGVESQQFLYCGSDDIEAVAWYKGNAGSKVHVVGGKKANELGLHDMSGNLWEWCLDGYIANPCRKDCNDLFITAGSNRVIRGGSWGGSEKQSLLAHRSFMAPDKRFDSLGFRLALVPEK